MVNGSPTPAQCETIKRVCNSLNQQIREMIFTKKASSTYPSLSSGIIFEANEPNPVFIPYTTA
jgi:hypothetical protein